MEWDGIELGVWVETMNFAPSLNEVRKIREIKNDGMKRRSSY